jgi:hypothetical protein
MSHIMVSEKHGVNPSLMRCPCCGKDTGVALLGRLPNDAEAPRQIPDVEPCEACRAEFTRYKTLGFVCYILQSGAQAEMDRIKDEDRHKSEKYRRRVTPWLFYYGVSVLKLEAAQRLFTNMDLSHGCAWIEYTLAKQIGLIKESAKTESPKREEFT